jgi:hypothetical protein
LRATRTLPSSMAINTALDARLPNSFGTLRLASFIRAMTGVLLRVSATQNPP